MHYSEGWRRSVCSCAFSFQGRQSQIACPMLNCKVVNGSLSSLYTWLKCVILFYTLLVSRTMTHAQSLWWCEHEGRSLLLGYTQIKHFLNIWIIIYMCFFIHVSKYIHVSLKCGVLYSETPLTQTLVGRNKISSLEGIPGLSLFYIGISR